MGKDEDNKKKKRQRGEDSQKSPKRDDLKKVKMQDGNNKPQTNTQQNAVVTNFIKAVKPIITKISLVETRKVCSKLIFSKKPIFKVINNSTTQISCDSTADKKLIIEALKQSLVNHFTYTEPSEKPFSLVLKGFYDIDPAQLLTILKEHQVPAIKTSVLSKSEHRTLYLVIFEAGSTTTASLMHNHRVIDDISIKWEPVKSKSKAPIQCHRCQRFGHTASNCGFQYRCVKCLESHPVGECSRKSREGNPQCCNCRGDHAANHRGCEVYKDYVKRVNSQKEIKNLPKNIIQNRLQHENFPALASSSQRRVSPSQQTLSTQPHSAPLHPVIAPHNHTSSQAEANQQKQTNVSYAERLKETVNHESIFTKLTEAHERLKRIPNIEDAVNHYCNFVDEIEKLPKGGHWASSFAIMVKYGLIKNRLPTNSDIKT